MDIPTRPKLLIVDNEPLIVEELCEFFESHGYICIGSESAAGALQLFHEDIQIGIVLSDMHMPDKNGIELIGELDRLCQHERLFEAAIFTGQAEKKDIIQALRAGVADYYQKPLDLEELLAGLQRLEKRLHHKQQELQLRHLNKKIQELAASLQEIHGDINTIRQTANLGHPLPAEPCASIPAAFAQLSPRQLAVAHLIAKGMTNYLICCELGITENTVKLYVSQILRITGMHNRTQLALSLSPYRTEKTD